VAQENVTTVISNFNHFCCLEGIEMKFGLLKEKDVRYLVSVENIAALTSIVLTQQKINILA